MYIGRFDSFIVTQGCKNPDSSSRFYRYIAQSGGRFVTGYGTSCEGAKADWAKLASTKHPDYTASGGGTSAKSVQKAQASGSSNTPASIFQPIFGTGKASIKASGSAGAGVTAGASVTATVSDLKAKTNQAVSDVLPDSIEGPIENAGIPLWMLPVGIVGAGLLLILMLRR